MARRRRRRVDDGQHPHVARHRCVAIGEDFDGLAAGQIGGVNRPMILLEQGEAIVGAIVDHAVGLTHGKAPARGRYHAAANNAGRHELLGDERAREQNGRSPAHACIIRAHRQRIWVSMLASTQL